MAEQPTVRCYICRATLDLEPVRRHIKVTGHHSIVVATVLVKCAICANADIRELTVTQVGNKECVVLCRDRCTATSGQMRLPNDSSRTALAEDGEGLDPKLNSKVSCCSLFRLREIAQKSSQHSSPSRASPPKSLNKDSPARQAPHPQQTKDDRVKPEPKQKPAPQPNLFPVSVSDPFADDIPELYSVPDDDLRRMPDRFPSKDEYKAVIEIFLKKESEEDRMNKSKYIRSESSTIVWKSGGRIAGEVALKSVKELNFGDKLSIEDSKHNKVYVSIVDIVMDSTPTKVSFKGSVSGLCESESTYIVDFHESVKYMILKNGLSLFSDSNEYVCDSTANVVLGLEVPRKAEYTVDVSDLDGLNESQVDAVRHALTTPFALIQGPPGTGKTKTAAAIVQKLHEMSGEKVLVCAPSNIAVDQLTLSLSRLPRLEGKLLRVYAKNRIERGEMKAEEFALHMKVREKLGERYKSLRGLILDVKNDVASVLSQANISENLKLLEESIVSQYPIVCCTCASSLFRRLCKKYDFLLIDEAGFASEADTLLPLLKHSSHVVLVGDHQQLPPVVFNKSLVSLGYERSLFERLIDSGLKPAMLKCQFRMHPDLSAFPSQQFYKGELQNGVSAADRVLPQLEEFKRAHSALKAVTYFKVDLPEESVENSYRNMHEIHVVLGILADLQRCGVSDSSIGVISPYEAQTKKLAEEILSDGRVSGKGVEIKNVDGFQGREKDIIIFTSVRSNPDSKIGFLSETRRLNVAITRARFGLIMVGNKAVVSSNPDWRDLISTLENKKCIRDGLLSYPH